VVHKSGAVTDKRLHSIRVAFSRVRLFARDNGLPFRAGIQFAPLPNRWISTCTLLQENNMANRQSGASALANREATTNGAPQLTRQQLIQLLNEDLSREYQAIIAYVVYSQTLKGAAYMNIANELEMHAKQELDHALIVAKQIDYLGGMPTVEPKEVRTSKDPAEMLQFDLNNENITVQNYRERVRQCEALGEYAMAEQIRQILVNEQEHQIDLAAALGKEVPQVTPQPK
jgi:bacterioferritin